MTHRLVIPLSTPPTMDWRVGMRVSLKLDAMYRAWLGREPSIKPMLKERGLVSAEN